MLPPPPPPPPSAAIAPLLESHRGQGSCVEEGEGGGVNRVSENQGKGSGILMVAAGPENHLTEVVRSNPHRPA